MKRVLAKIITFFVLCISIKAQSIENKKLSLTEAIMLAVRENPNVQQAQLSHVLAKFSVEVQQWKFQPQLQFQATKSMTRTVVAGVSQTNQILAIQPSATLNTGIGTQLSLTSTNNITGHYNPGLTLQVVQPLIRGFGRPVVEAALNNAIDSELISRLNMQGTLRTTITNVILAYLDVITAQHTIDIDTQALKRAEISVKQTGLFIKAGRKAGVELVTVKADVANAQKKLEDDKNSLLQTRYALLTAIGIDPNTEIDFSSLNVPALIKKYNIPPLNLTKQLVLDNDIAFKTSQITLQGATKRSVLIAKDNTRWQLGLTVNSTFGNGAGGGANAGFNSITNGYNQAQNAILNLTIPIDDKNAKEALLNAQTALKESILKLKQQQWQIETNAITGWNTISSAQRALKFAEDAADLQNKTYKISFQKYSYGLIDSLELQSAQQQMTLRQQDLLNAQITYLKSLVNMDQLDGNTLKTWNIEIQYE